MASDFPPGKKVAALIPRDQNIAAPGPGGGDAPVLRGKLVTNEPLRRLQTFSASCEPIASASPVGEKASDWTELPWFGRAKCSSPCATCQR
jgi:hypothetical protein